MIRRPPRSTPLPTTTFSRSQPRLRLVFLKKLRLQLRRQVMDLVLREQRSLNFFLGRLPREEIQEALFSQDEIHDLPAELQTRSEEHTSELQSHSDIACRLLP